MNETIAFILAAAGCAAGLAAAGLNAYSALKKPTYKWAVRGVAAIVGLYSALIYGGLLLGIIPNTPLLFRPALVVALVLLSVQVILEDF